MKGHSFRRHFICLVILAFTCCAGFLSSSLAATFSNPSPSSGSTNIPSSIMLTWRTSASETNTIYEVYFGTQEVLGSAHLQATVPQRFLIVDDLSPATKYFWQVVQVDGTTRSVSPIWQFTVGPRGPVQTFRWINPDSFYTNEAQEVTLMAKDIFGHTVTNYSGEVILDAIGVGFRRPSILLTEFNPRLGEIELMNVSTQHVSFEGWRLSVFDSVSWPNPKSTFTFPGRSEAPAEGIFVVRAGGTMGGVYPNYELGTNIVPGTIDKPLAFLLQNSAGGVEDYVHFGNLSPAGITNPIVIPLSEWVSAPVRRESEIVRSYSRINAIDGNRATDWRTTPSNIRNKYFGLQTPFVPGIGGMPLLPRTVQVTNGVAFFNLTLSLTNTEVRLLARDAQGVFGESGPFVVERARPLRLTVPALTREGAGSLTGTVVLPRKSLQPQVITLTSSDPGDLEVPSVITVPADQSEVVFSLLVKNDTLLNGPRSVKITASSDGFVDAIQAVHVEDDEKSQLQLVVPAQIQEGVGPIQVTLNMTGFAGRNIEVALSATPTNEISLPAKAVITSGESSVTFPISAIDDMVLDGRQQISLKATVSGWDEGTATVAVEDNEQLKLALFLPAQVRESSGILTKVGEVNLGAIAFTNVLVKLTSGVPGRFHGPEFVEVFAGKSNVTFDVTVVDNQTPEANAEATVTAEFGGQVSVSHVTILDDDPSAFIFSPIAPTQNTETEFWVTITALDQRGNTHTNFNGVAELRATDHYGRMLTLDPPQVGSFQSGTWTGRLRIAESAYLARIKTITAPGTSDVFHVLGSSVQMFPFPTSDLLFHDASNTLFATATSNEHGNKILALDPATMTVTNSYAIAVNPTQFESSPSGAYGYVMNASRNSLQRFDFQTRTGGRIIQTGPNSFIRDIAVLDAPGSDSVVVTISDTSGNSMGVWRYDNGIGTKIEALSLVDPYRIESGTGETFFGFQGNNDNPLFRYNRGSLKVVPNLISGLNIVHRAGVLYSDQGSAVDGQTLSLLGTYPAVVTSPLEKGYPEVDPVRSRVFYLTGRWSNFQQNGRILAFDQKSFSPLGSVGVPPFTGEPMRFISLRNHGLAFNTSGGQLYVVRSESIQPTTQPVDLKLSQRFSPEVLQAGKEFSFITTLSNTGPGTASILQLTNTLPAGINLVQTTGSTGEVQIIGRTVVWKITLLPADQSETLELRLSSLTAGTHTNVSVVTSFEPDSNFADNKKESTFYVELPSEQPLGAFVLNYQSQDLVYDRMRDRLLIAAAASGGGATNRLSIFNPYSGREENAVPLDARPYQLHKTPGSEFLYVSFKEAFRVDRFRMDTLSRTLSFGLGEEYHNNIRLPFYAGAMASVPGKPDLLAVWQVRGPNPIADEYSRFITLFDNGNARPNAIPMEGTLGVSLAFDAAGENLFGYIFGEDHFPGSIRRVSRYTFSPNGLAIAETYPNMDRNLGNSILWTDQNLLEVRGRSIDLAPFGISKFFHGSEAATAFQVEPSIHRVYFIAPKQTNWSLKTYDIQTARPLGELALPSFKGTPGSLTLWGTNGLAFRTSENQLCLIRTDLRQPSRQADLKLTIASADTSSEGTTVRVRLSNDGPAIAEQLEVQVNFDLPANSLQTTVDAGIWTNVLQHGVWQLSSLAPGTEKLLELKFKATPAGVYNFAASANTSSADVNRANNAAHAAIRVTDQNGTEPPFVKLSLPVTDLAWSPSNQKLLATVRDNHSNWAGSLISVAPNNLTIINEVYLGQGAGHLEITSDAALLHASVDYGLKRLSLPNLTLEAESALDSFGGNWVADDLKILPNQRNSVAVLKTINFSRLAVYDSGIKRTNTADLNTTSGRIGFAHTPNDLFLETFGYNHFHHYKLDEAGLLSPIIANLIPGIGQHEIEWVGDGFVASEGTYYDPFNRVVIGSFGSWPAGSQLTYDAASGRIFVVSPANNGVLVKAYDKSTRMELGNRTLSGITGEPLKLVRWGIQGLAFFTSGDEIVIFESNLLPSQAEADLRLEVTASAEKGIVGEPFSYLLTVTNHGPSATVGTKVLVKTGSALANATVSGPGFTNQIAGVNYILPIGPLAAGESVQLQVKGVPTTPGQLSFQAKAISDLQDSALRNNEIILATSVQRLLAQDDQVLLVNSVNDLVYRSSSERLYLSQQDGSVAVMNPATASLEESWSSSGVPGILNLSEDERYLYVGVNNGAAVRRYLLPENRFDLEIPLSWDSLSVAHVLSGDGRSLLLANGSNIQVFDNATPRSSGMVDSSGLFTAVQASGSSLVHGVGYSSSGYARFRTLQLSPEGAWEVAWGDPLKIPRGTSAYFRDHLIYTDSGYILSPASRSVVDVVPGLGQVSVFAEGSEKEARMIWLTRHGSNWRLQVYDAETRLPIGSKDLGALDGTPANLVRWGKDGLAFTLSNKKLLVMRSSLIHKSQQSALQLTMTTSNNPSILGALLETKVSISNNVGLADTNAVFSLKLPAGLSLAEFKFAHGTAITNTNSVIWIPGGLTSTQSVEATVKVRPLLAGHFKIQGSISTAQTDDPTDNTTNLLVKVEVNLGYEGKARLKLNTVSLAHDLQTGTIYATVSEEDTLYPGYLVAVHPVTGAIKPLIYLDEYLSKATLSSDGTRLFVLGAHGRRLHEVNTQTREVIRSSLVDNNTQIHGTDLIAIPGENERLVVVLSDKQTMGGNPISVVFDRGQRTTSSIAVPLLLFEGAASGVAFRNQGSPSMTRWFTLDESGFTEVGNFLFDAIIGEPVRVGNSIYTTWGQRLEGPTLQENLRYEMQGPVAPLPAQNRVAFVNFAGAPSLWVFEEQSGKLLGSMSLQSPGSIEQLVSTGLDRFIARSSAGELILIRSGLLPNGSKSDLAVSLQEWPEFLLLNQPFSATFKVENLGPDHNYNILVTNTLPPGVQLLATRITLTEGWTNESADAVRIPEFSPKASIYLSYRLVVTNNSIGTLPILATVSGAYDDPSLANNKIEGTLQFALDADADLLPDLWETRYGLNPTIAADASADLDQDGMSNHTEYLLGFDPASGESAFKLSIQPSTSTTLNLGLRFRLPPGLPVILKSSTDPNAKTWRTEGTYYSPTGEDVELSLEPRPGPSFFLLEVER